MGEEEHQPCVELVPGRAPGSRCRCSLRAGLWCQDGPPGSSTIPTRVSQGCSGVGGCSHSPGVNPFFMRGFFFHLNDSVTELQRVEELDEGRHLEPVLSVQAVPLLARHLQPGGQGRVQAAQPCGQHLGEGEGLPLNQRTLVLYSRTVPNQADCDGPCSTALSDPSSQLCLLCSRVYIFFMLNYKSPLSS